MKNFTNVLARGNLTARERFLTLIKNDVQRAKTGKDILTPADKNALENWKAKDNSEAHEWNKLNEGWMLSGRMDIEVELIYKDAHVSYLSQLPFIFELLNYPGDQRIVGTLKGLKSMKKVTIDEALEITKKQRDVKLQDGMDFEYSLYQLAFELLSLEDKKKMKKLYEEVEYDHQYLDQEEVIANLFNGKKELTQEAKEKLAEMVSESSYNRFAREYQLFHYFACIPILKIAKYFLKSKGIEVDIKKDDDDLYESDAVKEAMEVYAKEHGITIKEMLRKGCLAALNSGLLDDHTPLVISSDAELLQRWINSKNEARKILKKHIEDGELNLRKRIDEETRKEKLYSKKLYDGEVELSRQALETLGMETSYKAEIDEKIAFEIFDEVVITGESLYSFQKDYEFVKDFKERVDKYDPNLGLVYADDDPDQKRDHLDQELLICDFDKNGKANVFSRYGMSVTMLSNILEGRMFFKEVKEGGKTYLEFKKPDYGTSFIVRRQNLIDGYAQLLAFEEAFKKLDVIYEADMSHHISGRIKDVKEFIDSNNKAIRIATNTQEGDLERRGQDIFRRKDKLSLKEELIIDVGTIKPDEKSVESHIKKLQGIFGNF